LVFKKPSLGCGFLFAGKIIMPQKTEEKFILPKDRPDYIPQKKMPDPIIVKNPPPLASVIEQAQRRNQVNEETDIEEITNPQNVQEQHLEKIARGFIMGTNKISKRRDLRNQLEEQVVGKIGRKGKYLTDKLFELIEGVYVVNSNKSDLTRYYKQPPNLTAIMYALDRVIGKPGQMKTDDSQKQGILTIESIIKRFADGTSVEATKTVEVKS